MSVLRNLGLNAIVAFAASIWALSLIIQGADLPGEWWKPFSIVVGAVVLLLEAFEYWGWRIRWLHPWLINVPDLRGLWKGALTTQWVDPETGSQPEPIQVFIVVRQTFSRISIRMLTKESSSSLLAGQFSRAQDGEMVLTGTYWNTPRIKHRERSPIHYGGLLLEIPKQKERLTHVSGQYWTDRLSRGDLDFAWVCGSQVGDFDSARAMAEQGEP